MIKIDNALTQRIQEWLSSPKDLRDMIEGANILYSLNRNKALYTSILRRPEKYGDKLEYELNKFLRIRLDGMTAEKIVEMEKKLMPAARQIITVEQEMPAPKRAKGKRADHDRLPAHIRSLWDDNFTVYKQINLLFEELKKMNHLLPCDRYDKLQLLAAADKRYRANLAAYDSYDPGTETPEPSVISEEDRRKMGAARKSISKFRSRLTSPRKVLSDASREFAISTIQRNVDIVLRLGGGFSDDTIKGLSSFGIKF